MKNYDNFFLPADNMEESIQFYSETLGFRVKFDFSDKGMIAFNVGNEEPAIILKDKSKFPTIKPTIWFEVENVKETYAKLKEKRVAFLTEPYKIGTGWAVEFEDPTGNRLGLADYNKE